MCWLFPILPRNSIATRNYSTSAVDLVTFNFFSCSLNFITLILFTWRWLHTYTPATEWNVVSCMSSSLIALHNILNYMFYSLSGKCKRSERGEKRSRQESRTWRIVFICRESTQSSTDDDDDDVVSRRLLRWRRRSTYLLDHPLRACECWVNHNPSPSSVRRLSRTWHHFLHVSESLVVDYHQQVHPCEFANIFIYHSLCPKESEDEWRKAAQEQNKTRHSELWKLFEEHTFHCSLHGI